MAYSGVATYDSGTATVMEIHERDISNVVEVIAATETPFLDIVGDGRVGARSTKHEWIDDILYEWTDVCPTKVTTTTSISVSHNSRFRAGDLVQASDSEEVMLVSATTGTTSITVTRGYGGTTTTSIAASSTLWIIARAELEGSSGGSARAKTRAVTVNYTQIFAEQVIVSGTQKATKVVGTPDEMSYQVTQRTRELLLQLERQMIMGYYAASTAYGSSTVRRTMGGLAQYITAGLTNAASTALTETRLRSAIKTVWDGGGKPDLLLMNSYQATKIQDMKRGNVMYAPEGTTLSNKVVAYDSGFGLLKVMVNRHVPEDRVWVLDTTRMGVIPLRSWRTQDLANDGDYVKKMVLGEYTFEVRGGASYAHGGLYNLTTS